MARKKKEKPVDLWELTDEELATITFNGEPSCRLGYQYLSAAILYSAVNIQLEDDPYDIPGFGEEYRILVEMAFIMGLELDDDEVVDVLRCEVEEVAKLSKRGLLGEVKEIWNLHRSTKGKIDYVGIVDGLKLKHLLLGDRLFSGDSGNLEDVLTLIVMNVVKYTTDRKIPVLPAPKESFLMPLRYKNEVEEYLRTFYKENFFHDIGIIEFSPSILNPN